VLATHDDADADVDADATVLVVVVVVVVVVLLLLLVCWLSTALMGGGWSSSEVGATDAGAQSCRLLLSVLAMHDAC
jgi:hypothetical protein